MEYNLTEEDSNYLNKYSIDKFMRPSLTTDLVVLTVSNPQSIGKSLENGKLKILLVRRDHSPFKGLYALPGGFCVPDEDVEETAKRLLYEETNVKTENAEISGVYGSKNRDPRGWIISNSFVCLVRLDDVFLRKDKWETKWFDVDLKIVNDKYYLNLQSDSIIYENVIIKENNKFRCIKSCLAFDHIFMILDNLLKLSNKVKDNYKLAFNCLNEEFTLFEFQNVVESLSFKKLLVPNFRRDVKGMVSETGKVKSQGQFRPAKLFKIKEE